jgi:HEPN domain-containing protein
LAQTPQEWFLQAEYDLETARCMLEAGRNIYAVFMAHLAVEKAFKGIYCQKFSEMPPKTHSLMYFLKKNDVVPSQSMGEFIADLDQASIATRYPEELSAISATYSRAVTEDIVIKSKEVIAWAKKML